MFNLQSATAESSFEVYFTLGKDAVEAVYKFEHSISRKHLMMNNERMNAIRFSSYFLANFVETSRDSEQDRCMYWFKKFVRRRKGTARHDGVAHVHVYGHHAHRMLKDVCPYQPPVI